MKILTFDTEEWFIEKEYFGARQYNYDKYDAYLNRILNLLDQVDKKATFFCLGKLAADFPNVVKQIAARGHEIGCHSNAHKWLNKMSVAEFREDTENAIHSLEDLIGSKIKSYRAPAFSIGENNKWAFEILAEYGIERDASVFPAKRDFGGFDTFYSTLPTRIKINGQTIKEFPMPLISAFGKQFAYSGGGYFRFFPYRFIKKHLLTSDYGMAYFHIGDVMQHEGGIKSREEHEKYYKESGTFTNRLKRYVKTNLGTKHAFEKMCKVITTVDFRNLEEADKIIDWEKAPQKEF